MSLGIRIIYVYCSLNYDQSGITLFRAVVFRPYDLNIKQLLDEVIY